MHLHPLTARALGFPRAIAHGMWTYARALAILADATAGPSASHVWFAKPVLLPSTVELVAGGRLDQPEGVVLGLRSAKDASIRHLTLRVTSR
jgi:acyl dehydratase